MQVAHRVGHVVSFSAQHDRSRGCGEKEIKNELGHERVVSGRQRRPNVFYGSESYQLLLELLVLILAMVSIFSVSTILSIYHQRNR
jgi:hypothetical protein